jgi:hypothetical protein
MICFWIFPLKSLVDPPWLGNLLGLCWIFLSPWSWRSQGFGTAHPRSVDTESPLQCGRSDSLWKDHLQLRGLHDWCVDLARLWIWGSGRSGPNFATESGQSVTCRVLLKLPIMWKLNVINRSALQLWAREQDPTGICQAVATLLAGRAHFLISQALRCMSWPGGSHISAWLRQAVAFRMCTLMVFHGAPAADLNFICSRLQQLCSRSRYSAGLGTILGCHLVVGPSICSSWKPIVRKLCIGGILCLQQCVADWCS